ncbi:plasmid replication protein RepC [Haematobacter massiliensis]|uniref:plasmid replication protein RepC n=1 Tax=Haematobacter massiliensis TaxID=195105 RepID=UPI00103DF1A6|nr:plasmid replication protein RepC [Haematobacter massiliensis]QBJ26458.1 replication protein C [Haematobacter massiliensis]
MAFQHASAPARARTEEVLSADNTKPDRFTLIDTLRRAASALAISPSVIATVDALLSCLPPKRDHDIVFASNATLIMRRNGISDRSLRRHLADLVSAGLLVRIDSPNGKRYSKRDPQFGSVIRFGLDLAPLFTAFKRLQALAQEKAIEAQRVDYLRTKLRLAIRAMTCDQAECSLVAEAERALRRKLTSDDLENWLKLLSNPSNANGIPRSETTSGDNMMSASNGQNVRHHQKSEKELYDKAKPRTTRHAPPSGEHITLDDLAEACPQASGFLLEKLRSPWDVIAHAKRLAPMIGIDGSCYDAAEARHGPFGTALTIWGMLESLDRVRRPGAYFRSITSGKRSTTFDPWVLIDRLLKRSHRGNQSCPRTMSVFAIST